MAKRGRGPYPVPDGYEQLPEMISHFVGPPAWGANVSEEEHKVWKAKAFSLWTDVFAAIITGDLACYGVLPGLKFGSLPENFWSVIDPPQGPPGRIKFMLGYVEPLVKEADFPTIAALWARNPHNDRRENRAEVTSDVTRNLAVAKGPTAEAVPEALNATTTEPAEPDIRSICIDGVGQSKPKRRGANSLAEDDQPAVTEMRRLIIAGEARGPHHAAGIVMTNPEIARIGYGSDDAKVRRLERRYKSEFPDA